MPNKTLTIDRERSPLPSSSVEHALSAVRESGGVGSVNTSLRDVVTLKSLREIWRIRKEVFNLQRDETYLQRETSKFFLERTRAFREEKSHLVQVQMLLKQNRGIMSGQGPAYENAFKRSMGLAFRDLYPEARRRDSDWAIKQAEFRAANAATVRANVIAQAKANVASINAANLGMGPIPPGGPGGPGGPDGPGLFSNVPGAPWGPMLAGPLAQAGSILSTIGVFGSQANDMIARYRHGQNDIYNQQAARQLGYQVQQSSLPGYLTQKSAQGDLAFFDALLRNPQSMDRLKEIAKQAQIHAQKDIDIKKTHGGVSPWMGAVTMVGGALGVLAGTLTTAGTFGTGAPLGVPMSVWGGSMMAAGAYALGGGGNSILSGWNEKELAQQQEKAGIKSAEVSQAIVSAMEENQKLHPIRQMRVEQLTKHLNAITDLGLRTGVGDPSAFYGNVVTQGLQGNLKPIESLKAFYGAEQAFGSTDAAVNLVNSKKFGDLANAQQVYGVGQGAILKGLAGFSAMAGGPAGAVEATENLLRRAMAGGITDARLREAIVEQLPERLAQGPRGRSSYDATGDALEVAASLAKLMGRDKTDPGDVVRGAAGVQGADRPTLGGTNLHFMRRLVGLAPDVAKAFKIPLTEAEGLIQRYGSGTWANSEAEVNRIRKELGKNPLSTEEHVAGVKKILGGEARELKGGAAAAGLTVMGYAALATGATAEEVEAVERGGKAQPVAPGTPVAPPTSKPTQELKDIGAKTAAAEAEQLLKALGDPSIHEGLKKSAELQGQIGKLFSDLAKHDTTQMVQVTEALSKLFQTMNDAGYNVTRGE